MNFMPASANLEPKMTTAVAKEVANGDGTAVVSAPDAAGLTKAFESVPFDRMAPCRLYFAHIIPGKCFGVALTADVQNWGARLQMNRQIARFLERNGSPKVPVITSEFSACATLACEWPSIDPQQCLEVVYQIEDAYEFEKHRDGS